MLPFKALNFRAIERPLHAESGHPRDSYNVYQLKQTISRILISPQYLTRTNATTICQISLISALAEIVLTNKSVTTQLVSQITICNFPYLQGRPDR